MILLENVSKTFELSAKQRKERNTKDRELPVVNDVSFQCQPGRVFSLLGPNGAGKTTTLRMIATILKPSSGKIQIGGVDAIKQPLEALKKLVF